MRLIILVFLFPSLWNFCFSQDYSSGFSLLENGEFEEALEFFNRKIEEGQNDFTVRLCYGRALGLSGDPLGAKAHFQKMRNDYPKNWELELNYAESLMWSSQYQDAVSSYALLFKQDSASFPAILGYANSLSAVKNYSKAADIILKASKMHPENQNAHISRKYIFLGLANQYKLVSKIKEAEVIYEELDSLFPNDIDVVLNCVYLKLDQNRLKAAEDKILEFSTKGEKDYRIFSTLASIKLRQLKYRKALDYLILAKEELYRSQLELPFDVMNLEFNIHISSRNYKKAEELLSEIDTRHGRSKSRDLWINYLIAMKDFKKIESILEGEDKDFLYTTMTKVSLAKGDFKSARSNLDSVSKQSENESVHFYLGREIAEQFYHGVDLGFENMKDNGGNYAESYRLNAISSQKNRSRIYLAYQFRKAYTNEFISASSKRFELGVNYQLKQRLNTQFVLAHNKLTNNFEESNTSFQFAGKLKIDISNSHYISLDFAQNTFNYNVELINKSIANNNIGLQYYNMFLGSIGGYLETKRSYLSDANRSNFLYASVFKNFTTIPLLQVGLNYTFLSYDWRSNFYFSPDSYNVKEVFLKFDNSYHPNHKFIFSASVGVGRQKIDSEDQQFTQRLDLVFGYKFGGGQRITTYYSYNNSASATLSGYQARRIGVRANLRF